MGSYLYTHHLLHTIGMIFNSVTMYDVLKSIKFLTYLIKREIKSNAFVVVQEFTHYITPFQFFLYMIFPFTNTNLTQVA